MARRTQHFDPRQNMQGDSYEVFHYLDMASRHLEAHYHDFYEIFLFQDGEVDYWIDGSLYHLQPGDLLLIRPTELHRPVPRTDSDVYERTVLWLDRTYLSAIGDGQLEACFADGRHLLRPDPARQGHIRALTQQLVEEVYGGGYGGDLCAFGLLLQLLTAINRATRGSTAVDADRTPTLITSVLTYIGAHFHEPLTLDGLAAHFFVSKYHLSHEFRRAVGTGVHRYITMKRLNSAYERLTAGQAPGQVSIQCGFTDYTAFYKAFKAEFGVSPTAVARR